MNKDYRGNNSVSQYIPVELIDNIVDKAMEIGMDPLTAVALAYNESTLGVYDSTKGLLG